MRKPPPWVLWLGLAAAMYAAGLRKLRRAALRGLVAAAVTRLALMLPPVRGRYAEEGSVAAFIAGVLLEEPKVGAPAAVLAVGLETDDGEDVLPRLGAASLGVGIAAASTRVWPVPPRLGPTAPNVWLDAEAEPSEDGRGLTIAVNVASGGDDGDEHVESLRKLLPQAEVLEIDPDEGDELRKALDSAAAEGAIALGVSGGDGSINTAAQVALEAGKPLMVVPGGTFNHLTQAVGVESLEEAVEAVREGEAVGMDVATIGGHVFLNTASFGSYVQLVDTRQRLEKRIGKWPAMVVALARVLRHSEPIEVEIEGEAQSVWMAFIGNCRYHPSGFAPTWRERLDDGLLDIRYVRGDQPWSRTRLILAVLTGRLGRSKIYRQTSVERMHLRSLAGPIRLARDGETFEGPEDIVIEKLPTRLALYVLHDQKQ
ncbi:MAG TPA: diacylglycerol kinase family protein [Actinomycetota bacterium]|nr:diacylglycerol kinase family protein [Actinomycetota bacterium]